MVSLMESALQEAGGGSQIVHECTSYTFIHVNSICTS